MEPVHLYQRLAGEIEHLIQAGTLRSGDRVPSVRKLVRQQAVSASTALQAFQLLEGRGLIEARPRSGYYVRPPQWKPAPEPGIFVPVGTSRKLNMAALVMEVVGALNRPGLVNLGAAVAPPELLPNRELHRALAAASRRQPALANACDPSPGLRALRVQIARRALDAGCALSPDDVVITNGVSEALHLCLRAVTRPGDTVAIESPTYFGILQTIEMLGLRACEIPTSPQHGVCLEELERRLSRARVKACVFTTNFSNPLGSCMNAENKRLLVDLLARRGIPLIEDDIYGDLAFGDARPDVAKAYDREGMVLLCSSMNKTLAPGYQIGWVVPGKFKDLVHRLKHTCSVGNPMVTQLALAEYLATGHYERHLRRLRRLYAGQMERMSACLACHWPAGIKVSRPQGGQLLWVELPKEVDALELHRVALAAGISLAPGPIFSARQQYRNCVRLSCANPWSATIETALIKLGTLVRRSSSDAKPVGRPGGNVPK